MNTEVGLRQTEEDTEGEQLSRIQYHDHLCSVRRTKCPRRSSTLPLECFEIEQGHRVRL